MPPLTVSGKSSIIAHCTSASLAVVGLHGGHQRSLATKGNGVEQSGPSPTNMTLHRHLTILEWHGSPDVVSYIDRDRPELIAQQSHVVDVISANREGAQ